MRATDARGRASLKAPRRGAAMKVVAGGSGFRKVSARVKLRRLETIGGPSRPAQRCAKIRTVSNGVAARSARKASSSGQSRLGTSRRRSVSAVDCSANG